MNICKDLCKDCGEYFEVKITVGSIAIYNNKKGGVDFTTFFGINSNVFAEAMQETFRKNVEKYSQNDDVLVIPILFDSICNIPKKDFKKKYINLTDKKRPGNRIFKDLEKKVESIFSEWLDSNI